MPLPAAVGQHIAIGFHGRTPPAAVRSAISEGRVGGVILFADNVSGLDGTRTLVARLQKIARDGGQPPLAVMVDQEGGTVKRLPGSPQRSAAAMAQAGVARSSGAAAAKVLRRAGVGVDLAPVADVADGDSFLGTRAFGGDPADVARNACAFADGLRAGGVGATLKHFPGLGRADGNTDLRAVTVRATVKELDVDLAAYTACAKRVPLVMMASAVYPAIDAEAPAVLSPQMYKVLRSTGFRGLTVSDAFDTPALNGRHGASERALRAGLDILLYGQGGAGLAVHRHLLGVVRGGGLSAAKLRASAARIIAWKQRGPASLP